MRQPAAASTRGMHPYDSRKKQYAAGCVIDNVDIPVIDRKALHLQILTGAPSVPVNHKRHTAQRIIGDQFAASEIAEIDQPVPEPQLVGIPEPCSLGKLQRQEIHLPDPIRNRR